MESESYLNVTEYRIPMVTEYSGVYSLVQPILIAPNEPLFRSKNDLAWHISGDR